MPPNCVGACNGKRSRGRCVSSRHSWSSLRSGWRSTPAIGHLAIMTAAPSPAGGYEALAVVQSNYATNVRLGSLDGPMVQAAAVNP